MMTAETVKKLNGAHASLDRLRRHRKGLAQSGVRGCNVYFIFENSAPKDAADSVPIQFTRYEFDAGNGVADADALEAIRSRVLASIDAEIAQAEAAIRDLDPTVTKEDADVAAGR